LIRSCLYGFWTAYIPTTVHIATTIRRNTFWEILFPDTFSSSWATRALMANSMLPMIQRTAARRDSMYASSLSIAIAQSLRCDGMIHTTSRTMARGLMNLMTSLNIMFGLEIVAQVSPLRTPRVQSHKQPRQDLADTTSWADDLHAEMAPTWIQPGLCRSAA